MNSPDWFEDVKDELNDAESCAHWLVAIKAFEAARLKKGHYLGLEENGGATEADLEMLK